MNTKNMHILIQFYNYSWWRIVQKGNLQGSVFFLLPMKQGFSQKGV